MEKKPKLVMMKGLPLSGKTEWAKAWVSASHDRIRVSWSDMMGLMGERRGKDQRVLAFEAAVHLTVQALKSGVSVVLDEMNLDGTTWGIFQLRAQQCKAVMEWHNMKVSAEECKRRNAELGHPVSDMEIDRLDELFGEWLKR